MKILNTRLIFTVLLAMLSIGSYVFLTTVSNGSEASNSKPIEIELKESIQDKASTEETDTEITLPDVQLLKFVIETGKRFLPAS
ncbi:MAG: hypothetical protein R2828_32535 [Saprospiraceae bacterium]